MTTPASTVPTTPDPMKDAEIIPYVRTYNDAETSAFQPMREYSDAETFSVEVLASGVADIETFKAMFRASVLCSSPSGGWISHGIRFFQCGEDPASIIIADFGEPASEFPEEQQEIIDLLRGNGRDILANKLVAMLRDVQEDPNDPEVSIVSLRQMAWFFVEQQNFADPFLGPDRHGLVHAEWKFLGNGVLVMVFPGDGVVLLVAQADETPDGEKLDICTKRTTTEVLKEFGHLVPHRY